MTTILHSSVSVVHLLAALLAMTTGTYILFTRKGTARHRFVGRIYIVSMVLLLVTAFQIYYLFGRFGIIHWGAVGSVSTLLMGVGVIGLRAHFSSWLQWHYLGMGASVTGLYAAFVVESTYRLFQPAYFWWITLGAANAVFAIGAFLLYRHYPDWASQTAQSLTDDEFRRENRVVDTANQAIYRKAV
ncbi:hypothetical protein [Spirosoma sp. KUDC1026]|uniref:hypothetical protein n=1 Tax=Spirosoma sp. KUDC1026 TaxID=2745947 RepID=UPI00159BAD44|nr:hypothetical protein [Spirosoma sp. KUDC1026]QKZ13321.1 hypothetical protein HU175_12035 [Spirosoma sp. KUDC1026]